MKNETCFSQPYHQSRAQEKYTVARNHQFLFCSFERDSTFAIKQKHLFLRKKKEKKKVPFSLAQQHGKHKRLLLAILLY